MSSTSKQKANRPNTRLTTSKFDGLSIASSLFKALFSGISLVRGFVFLIILTSIIIGLWMLPLEKMLTSFLIWLKRDVGIWGPVIMALAYIPLTILAVPASLLTLGGGYVFGLTVGFIADSLGSTLGAMAAFIVGKTIGRSYVNGKLKDFPQFQAISSAIGKSGFKIVLLLRLVPLVPFNIMNYLLAVTPISVFSYTLASWIGMMPSTFVFVYIGTTIKDISDLGVSGKKVDANQWWVVTGGFILTGVAMFFITRIAREILQKAIEEHESEKNDDKPSDEERPAFRSAVSMPDINAQELFKPLRILEAENLKEGHRS